jgi:hypothetical protein
MRPLAIAWGRAWARPRVLVALTLLNLALSFAAARPLSAALSTVIDLRPAASTMLRPDDGLIAELLTDHRELIAAAFGGAQVALLVYGVLAWLLAGGLLVTLALPRELSPRGSLSELVAASAAHATRMLALGALGLVVRLLPIALGAATWFALKPIFLNRGFAELATWTLLTALLFALAWSTVTVALDYARALALLEPMSVLRALGRGLRLALSRPTASIVLFSLVGETAVTLAQVTLSHALPNHGRLAYAAAIALRVAGAFARAAVGVTALVAAGTAVRTGLQAAPRTPAS